MDSAQDDKQQQAAPGTRRWLWVVAIPVLIALIAVAVSVAINQIKDRRFENDPYIRANEEYKQALASIHRGDDDQAERHLRRVIKILKKPGAEPPVQSSNVTYNAYSLLAYLAANRKDCEAFEEYREAARRVADQKWSFRLMGEEKIQSAEKKETIIADSEYSLQKMEARCRPGSSLPVDVDADAPYVAAAEQVRRAQDALTGHASEGEAMKLCREALSLLHAPDDAEHGLPEWPNAASLRAHAILAILLAQKHECAEAQKHIDAARAVMSAEWSYEYKGRTRLAGDAKAREGAETESRALLTEAARICGFKVAR